MLLAMCACGCIGATGEARTGALERKVDKLTEQVEALRQNLAVMRDGEDASLAASDIGSTHSSGGVKITRISEKVNLVEGVIGSGLSADAAMSDAHRRAVEAGAGTYIDSKSSTEDFALIRDTIYARSRGFIQNVEELRPASVADGVWTVVINAEVSISGIDDFWGATRALLERLGNPKIMVSITESIGGRVEKSSTLQTRVEGLLIKSGFLLVDKKQLARIMKGRSPSESRAAAKSLGAQLFIVGNADAIAGTPRSVGDVWLYSYDATGNLRCYRSDTGQVVSSHPGRSRGVHTAPTTAAKRSLAALADAIAPQLQKDILYHWKEVLEKKSRTRMTKPD